MKRFAESSITGVHIEEPHLGDIREQVAQGMITAARGSAFRCIPYCGPNAVDCRKEGGSVLCCECG